MPVLQPEELVATAPAAPRSRSCSSCEDRNDRPLVLAMTHEEAVTFHVSRDVRSYRDLPLILYHVQIKERDEPRPRAGVLRTREFIMKDSYSFDRDEEGLDASYELHIEAYDRIFDRCGLRWYRVESDVGMMGGLGAHEYMAPCPAGENEVALSDAGYAANVEVAHGHAAACPTFPPPLDRAGAGRDPGRAHDRGGLEPPRGRPGDADQVAAGRDAEDGALRAGARARRPPPERDQAPERARLGRSGPPPRRRSARTFGAEPGLHRPGRRRRRRARRLRARAGHLRDRRERERLSPARRRARARLRARASPTSARSRRATAARWAARSAIEPAIEVGNIFKLGTRYSEPLGATYLDEDGERAPDRDGQLRDRPGADRGRGGRAVRRRARDLVAARDRALRRPPGRARQARAPTSASSPSASTRSCAEAGLDVLYDDRDASPGEKFVEAELLGCPLRVVAGKRSLESGELEVQVRRGTREALGPDRGRRRRRCATLLAELP